MLHELSAGKVGDSVLVLAHKRYKGKVLQENIL